MEESPSPHVHRHKLHGRRKCQQSTDDSSQEWHSDISDSGARHTSTRRSLYQRTANKTCHADLPAGRQGCPHFDFAQCKLRSLEASYNSRTTQRPKRSPPRIHSPTTLRTLRPSTAKATRSKKCRGSSTHCTRNRLPRDREGEFSGHSPQNGHRGDQRKSQNRRRGTYRIPYDQDKR